jgi:tetratricopeptide (TPR) repeat protein
MTKTLALLLLLACPARAAFDDAGVSARATGMGNAFTAIADDAFALQYNPAGLALLTRPEIATSYTRHMMGLGDSSQMNTSFLGYAHPLRGGANGTVAGAWQQFALNSGDYQEQSFYLSYGRLLAKDLGRGDFYGGLSGKYLRRSFGTFPEASNAMGGASGFDSRGADSVLASRPTSGAVDTDLGFLYRLKQHYAFGLAIQHLNEPNVAFSKSDSDRLARAVSLGLAYRSLLSNIALQVNTRKSPSGSQDLTFTTALERWFPKLFIGEFGMRGALAIGSRDYKEISTGLSYRTRRIQIDYGFGIPVGGLSTAGSHRVGISVRFGKLSEPDESVVMILEAMRQLKSGVTPELHPLGPGLSAAQKASLEELLTNAMGLSAQARYREASDRVSRALTLSPGDTELLKYFGRLNFVSQPIPSLPRYKTDAADASLHQGILSYLAFSDIDAVAKVAVALSLRPDDKSLDAFLSELESATGIKRPEVAKVLPVTLKATQLLTEAATALEAGKYDEAIALSLKVIEIDPNNINAWENLGTAYFSYGDYANSLTAWEKALALEPSAARRSALNGYISSIRKLLVQPKPQRVEGGQRLTVSPHEIQRLYNQGVDDYTAGRLESARAAFRRVVELDPNYVPAKKALLRVEEEMSAR